MRPYKLKDKVSGAERLVEGDTQAQVLGFAARERFEVSTPNAAEVARMMGSGVRLEKCKPDAPAASAETAAAQAAATRPAASEEQARA